MMNTTIFNVLANTDNLAIIGINSKKADTFKSFDLTFISENPLELKSHLLMSEYRFQLEEIAGSIKRLRTRYTSLENTISDYQKQAKKVIGGVWTKEIKGIKYTLEELENDYYSKMNAITDKILELQKKADSIKEIAWNTELDDWYKTIELTGSETVISSMLRYSLLGSKCLTIKDSFTDLADACQKFNRDTLKGSDTKESYLAMKKEFSNLFESVKVTKDTVGQLVKVKTVSLNQEETKVCASALFSCGEIGTVNINGSTYYTLTAENRLVILDNIVKLVVMKLQGVKVNTDNI